MIVFERLESGSFEAKTADLISFIKQDASSPQKARDQISASNVQSVSIIPMLASPIDLTSLGLGEGMHLPIDLRTRPSVYELQTNEPVDIGLIVTSQGMFTRRVTFLGEGKVQDGSHMRLEIVAASGEVVKSSEGSLEIVDASIGHGQINVEDSELLKTSVWVIWSGIYVKPAN